MRNKTWGEEVKDFLADILLIIFISCILILKFLFLIFWPMKWLKRSKEV